MRAILMFQWTLHCEVNSSLNTVTTAGGEGGKHESAEVPGCPEDRKRDGGRGGRGVVASRAWELGPIRGRLFR